MRKLSSHQAEQFSAAWQVLTSFGVAKECCKKQSCWTLAKWVTVHLVLSVKSGSQTDPKNRRICCKSDRMDGGREQIRNAMFHRRFSLAHSQLTSRKGGNALFQECELYTDFFPPILKTAVITSQRKALSLPWRIHNLSPRSVRGRRFSSHPSLSVHTSPLPLPLSDWEVCHLISAGLQA